jgi:hypothetical protein
VISPHFTGTIEAGRGGGAFVVLPQEVMQQLGGGARIRVTGRLNGVDFASSTMAIGDGRVCLGVHKATREGAAVGIGDSVEIDIERDTTPRELQLPHELVAAFATDSALQTAFDRMSFTRRKECVDLITSAKREETRERRVAETLHRLRN